MQNGLRPRIISRVRELQEQLNGALDLGREEGEVYDALITFFSRYYDEGDFISRRVYKDGTYTGWGTSRHGDIQASVAIEGGRIASVTIAQCLTRYSCSWIAALPPQVIARQSPETDYVSGATQSTNALYYAVVEALAKAVTLASAHAALMGTMVTVEVLGPLGRPRPQPRAPSVRLPVVPRRVRAAASIRQRTPAVVFHGRRAASAWGSSTALEFALAVAEESDGAFDPTVGQRLEARGLARTTATTWCRRSPAMDPDLPRRSARPRGPHG
jgi:uncharacterized protein with FMN-binding domain